MSSAGFAAAAGTGFLPGRLFAQEPISVAGIYTVPVEQQWVSRIHIAAEAAKAAGQITYTFSENTSNTDYPRVMREYAESGVKLIVGEIFGVEQEAREAERLRREEAGEDSLDEEEDEEEEDEDEVRFKTMTETLYSVF